MKRIAAYVPLATLGTALLASGPAAAQMGFGIDIGYPAYPPYYSRIYGYPYGYASYPYSYPYPYSYSAYSYPYAYSAWNYRPYYGWGGPFGGIASLAAAPIEVAGAVANAPFAVAANTRAPLVTGRSVVVERRASSKRVTGPRYAHHMRHVTYGRSAAYVHRRR
jgi:hypothetical protein